MAVDRECSECGEVKIIEGIVPGTVCEDCKNPSLPKPSRNEAVKMVADILNDDCENPAAAIIAQGQALVKIGEALRGQSTTSAKAIMLTAQSVCELSDGSK